MCTFNENNENIRRLLRRLRRRRSGGDRLGMVRIKHGDWRVIDVVPLLFQFRDVKFRELRLEIRPRVRNLHGFIRQVERGRETKCSTHGVGSSLPSIIARRNACHDPRPRVRSISSRTICVITMRLCPFTVLKSIQFASSASAIICSQCLM